MRPRASTERNQARDRKSETINTDSDNPETATRRQQLGDSNSETATRRQQLGDSTSRHQIYNLQPSLDQTPSLSQQPQNTDITYLGCHHLLPKTHPQAQISPSHCLATSLSLAIPHHKSPLPQEITAEITPDSQAPAYPFPLSSPVQVPSLGSH